MDFIFNASLEKQGQIGNLGVNEYIYASYYIDHMAYFVTYRNTDPVFAVDIADAKNPKLCSELKLPGYSDYLHSFGENQMVGIGYEDEQNKKSKISLFEIDDKKVVSEASKKVLSDEWLSLMVDDHRAVFVDEEKGLLGFYAWDSDKTAFRYYLFEVKEDSMVSLWETTLKESRWTENVRGVRIGDIFYAITDEGRTEACILSDVRSTKDAEYNFLYLDREG